MKIKELVRLIGIYERVRVINSQFDEVEVSMAKDLSPEALDRKIKAIYADKSTVSIIIE